MMALTSDPERREIFQSDITILERFFDLSDQVDGYVGVLKSDQEIFAIVINELLSSDYALGHFLVVDYSTNSEVRTSVFVDIAQSLVAQGIKYLNIEQDLGIPGLRQKKMQLRPDFFIKKYIISKNN